MKLKIVLTLQCLAGILIVSFIPLSAQSAPATWQASSRLFTSPLERTRLDGMRQAASAIALQAQESKKEPEAEAEVTLPSAIVMQGYVKRNDGQKSTVWINHQALQENGATTDVQIGSLPNKSQQDSHTLSLKLPSNGQKFNLKAGQSYLPDENRVVDVNGRSLNGKNEN
jgi:hypothetical protein